jgi:two-component system chemotaxis sensor kinase CheA
MADTTAQSASDGAGIDLSRFYQVFFEEAGENLDKMEQLLLALDLTAADDEELNAVFRCAHSIKGGAATFGFADVAELTHQMETLLDKLRRRELAPNAAMVDTLLTCGDALRHQLARHRGVESAALDTTELVSTVRALAAGSAPLAAPGTAAATAARRTTLAPEQRVLELRVGPLDLPSDADNLIELFQEIVGLGTIEQIDDGIAVDRMRRFRITTTTSDDDLLDLFTFHVSREQVLLTPLGEQPVAAASELAIDLSEAGYGFFADAPGAPSTPTAEPATSIAAPALPVATKPGQKIDRAPTTPESSTLRVSVEKVDQLINLMGELVITQAMLAQTCQGLEHTLHQQLATGLAALDRNTRDLQEAVMSIRMIPMSVVFSRFPRMLRDLAGKLDKKVDFVTIGEATELDKGLVERITDPLTHLVRNSCDHGIETPAERIAAGKSETGTITLSASHQGGSIAIEVRDDGKGLSREKLLKKARERGLHAPDSMSDNEVWNLIFAPGFSTAEIVTDVSGRGVGMDVVKKNITALGGTVEIDSAEGYGMRVSVRLPLTLAIMDAMSVGVGGEVYILPLSSVVESLQVRPDLIKTIGGTGRVVEVREEYMPVLDLEALFDVPRTAAHDKSSIMVVVESEGGRVALLVDELIGQHQVVVKNLEANYRKVDDVSGATIMGDGRVALILDIGSLVRRSRH